MVPMSTVTSAHRSTESSDDTREQILGAAAELFAEHGYEVSMRKLAAAIGYTATTIYNYFDGKDDLIFAVVDQAFARFRSMLRTARESHEQPVDQLAAMGAAYLRFAAAHPQHYRLMFVMRPEFLIDDVPDMDGCRMDTFDILIDTVVDALGHQERSEEAQHYADAIWSAVHGLAMLHLSMPEGFDEARTHRALEALNEMVRSLFPPRD
jgi:AcrR family transcriptional regulator